MSENTKRFGYIATIPSQSSTDNQGVFEINEHYELTKGSNIVKPPFSTTVEYLVVAGGGGGGGGNTVGGRGVCGGGGL